LRHDDQFCNLRAKNHQIAKAAPERAALKLARRFRLKKELSVSLNVHDLAAFVHAGLQINVVWTAQFARGFILNPSHSLHFLA
jgi:hypothetical protein